MAAIQQWNFESNSSSHIENFMWIYGTNGNADMWRFDFKYNMCPYGTTYLVETKIFFTLSVEKKV